MLPCLFALLHWPFPTVAFLDLRRVSISFELEYLLLSMCIKAPESTSNSRSSGDFEISARLCLNFNWRIKRSILSFLKLVNMFAKSHAALQAHLSYTASQKKLHKHELHGKTTATDRVFGHIRPAPWQHACDSPGTPHACHRLRRLGFSPAS